MTRIEGGTRAESIRCLERGANFARRGSYNPSRRSDGSRHPRVRRREQPAVIFDGAHFGLLQVLLPGAAVAVPAVVRDIQQNLCALQRSLAHFIGKDRFVADERSQTFAAGLQWRVRSAVLKFSDLLSQASRKCKEFWKR